MISACGENSEDEKEDLIETPDTVKTTVLNVAGELFSVPSPVQTALLIQQSGVPYNKSILNPANKINNYSTDFSRAVNLGIFGADLGYVSLYNQTQDALGYLASIKQLSDKLGLSAAFDAATMERIRNNITNKDSMMVLVGIAYRASDAYLKNNQRADVSSVILAGGWIESMHFSVSALKEKPSDRIRYRLAEQKQALNSLIRILGQNADPEAAALTAKLNELSQIFEGIEFKYKFAEPTTDTVKKVTYINSKTEVNVSEEQIRQISQLVEEIRNSLVGNPQTQAKQ